MSSLARPGPLGDEVLRDPRRGDPQCLHDRRHPDIALGVDDDAEAGDRQPAAVEDGHRDPRGALVDVSDELGPMVGPDRLEHPAQDRRIRRRVLGEGRERTAQVRLTDVTGSVGEEDETARRGMGGQTSRGARAVDDRARLRHPFDEEDLAFAEDPQLRVLPDEIVEVGHVRAGQGGELDGVGGAVRQLPHPHPDADPPRRIPLQEVVAHHVVDEAIGRRLRQLRPRRELVGAQRRVVRIEGAEDADEPIDHRIARW